MTRPLTTVEFIAKARTVHGDRFDYSNTVYVRAHDLIKISCSKHGEFLQKAYSHLNGRGCPKCSGRMLSNNESFIKSAFAVHGDIYDYSLVDYQGNKKLVSIICKSHGVFRQVPNSHLNGRGCSKCSKTAYKKDRLGYVYLLASSCFRYMKIGITNKPQQRFSELRSRTPLDFVVICVYQMPGVYAPIVERSMHQLAEHSGFEGFQGATEWFYYSLELEYILHCMATQLE